MPVTSHIRRIAVIAVVGCAILAAGPAPRWRVRSTTGRRPLPSRSTVAASEGSDWTLPIVVAGAVVLVRGTLGYSHHSHASRRVTA